MKLKGITVIEQHAEKIVLGLVTLAFLAVLSLQFLVPSTVEVDPEETRDLGSVYEYLGSKASNVIGRMENPATPPEFDRPELMARLESSLNRQDGIEVAALPASPPALPEIEGVLEGPDGPVAVFDPPAPERTMARSQWLTADPYFVNQRPVLRDYIEGSQPYDLPMVTVQAWFDGAELAERLANPPEGERAIPVRWLDRGLEVLAVEIERQRLLPDGTWGPTERPESAPWFPSVLEFAGLAENAGSLTGLAELSPGEVLDLARAARDNQEFIALPPLLPAISGPEWVPPALADEQEAALEAQREVARLDRQQSDRQSTGRQSTRDRDARSRDRDFDRGRRDTRDPAPADRGADLQQRIDERFDQIDAFAELRSAYAEPFDLRSGEEFTHWTHDIGVEPGATYRYRTRLVINNPLYGEGPRLNAQNDPERLAESEKPTVRTGWSAWADPVDVGRRQYLFVSGTQPFGGPTGGEPRATVEMFTMFYGYYRRDVRTFSPGEAVFGEIEIPASSWVYDPEQLDTEAASTYFEALNEYEALDEAERDDAERPVAPDGLRLVDQDLRIEARRLLVDVAPDITGTTGPTTLVTFYDAETGLTQRTSASDRARAAYERVRDSNEAGSTAEPRKPGEIR